MHIQDTDSWMQALGLPYDTAMGYPRLTVAGKCRLRLENHRGLRELSDTQISFASARGPVTITGQGLVILAMDRDGVTIQGNFRQIDLSGLA